MGALVLQRRKRDSVRVIDRLRRETIDTTVDHIDYGAKQVILSIRGGPLDGKTPTIRRGENLRIVGGARVGVLYNFGSPMKVNLVYLGSRMRYKVLRSELL